ncbi:MAG: histidinol dehydrogenase [Thermoleophilia bacterium]
MSEVRRRELADASSVGAVAREVRPPAVAPDIAGVVRDIIREVRDRGDAALVDDARRFGAPGFTAARLRVAPEACAEAARALPPDLRTAIDMAAGQVRALARATLPQDRDVDMPAGQRITVRSVPVAAAGCYVPGGRAAYPSSLIMAVVPAQEAGVPRVAVASPAGPDGAPHPVIMATAHLLGVEELYAVGGAAAVAALAYGTHTIPPVAVITGPGSSWVQEAKRQVTDTVGIDGFAGPSEVVVIADATASPRGIALDLLAQAEHGPDSFAVLATHDPAVIDAVADAIAAEGTPVGAVTLVRCADPELSLALAEEIAPEHLEVCTADADALVARVTRAGAVFVGPHCATAYGDYVAGSNHVLPTGGAARFASALGTSTYLRRMSVVHMTDAAVRELTPHLLAIAEAEGFTMHAASAAARLETTEGPA